MDSRSPFLERPVIAENEHAFAIRDAFPVTPGHCLVISKRVVSDYFSLTRDEQEALWDLIHTVKQILDEEIEPDGYNVGINVGKAAGQTIPHVHVHLIPRKAGDHSSPRGGIRAVIPGKADY